MKKIIFMFSIVFVFSCSKKAEVTVSEVGPRISEGYYSINNPDQYNLPLVAVKSENGNMDSYGFLKFQCDDKIYQSYDYAGTTFSDRPVSLAGRSVNLLSHDCEIKTDIQAESENSIRVKVIINDKEVDSYSLVKVSKEDFIQELKSFVENDSNIKIEEKICQKSLDLNCDILNLQKVGMVFNMRKIIFLKIILVSIFSLAQDKNIDVSESLANREKNKYQAYYQSMGSSPIGTAPIVLGAGYYLNSNQLLSLEFTSGDGDASLASKFASALTGLISDRKESRQSKSVGFHIKQFVGNSFYYKFGVDANSLKYRVTWTDGSHQAGEYSFNGTSTTLGFQIGNQWLTWPA